MTDFSEPSSPGSIPRSERSYTPRADRHRLRAVVLVLAVAATARAYLVAQEAVAPFIVGVWGQGDAILPFADFDGRSWRSSWPTSVEAKPDVRPIERTPAMWWGRSTFEPVWELIEPSGRRLPVRIIL